MVNIRPARQSDCSEIVELIKDLEESQNLTSTSRLTAKDLTEDGFGENPYFYCLVAEETTSPDTPRLVGHLIYFFTYSTSVGRCIYVEDFYVKPETRKQGIGTKLFQAVTKIALEKDCRCVCWSVLDSNQLAIDYYKHIGGQDLTKKEGWHSYGMDKAAMDKFIS